MKVNIKEDMKGKGFIDADLIETNRTPGVATTMSYNIDYHEDGTVSERYGGTVEDIIRLVTQLNK